MMNFRSRTISHCNINSCESSELTVTKGKKKYRVQVGFVVFKFSPNVETQKDLLEGWVLQNDFPGQFRISF